METQSEVVLRADHLEGEVEAMFARIATCVAARRGVGHGVLAFGVDEVGIAEQLAVCPSEAIGEMQEVGVTQRLDPRHLTRFLYN